MAVNPAMLRMMLLQQAAQQQGTGNEMPQQPQQMNPISSGSMAGIESAKRSLEMSESEKRKALGSAIMHFGSAMGQTGHGPGLAGALGRINAGFIPGLNAYQQQEQMIGHRNAALLQRQDDLERQQRLEAFRERELANQMAHQALAENLERERFEHEKGYKQNYLDLMREKAAGRNGKLGQDYLETPEGGTIDLSKYAPITTTAQKNMYSKDKLVTSSAISKVKEALKNLDKFEEEAKEDTFRTDRPWGWGKSVTGVKTFGAFTGKNKHLKEEVKRQSKLKDSLASVRTMVESGAKNGGTPGEQMMKRWEQEGLSVHFEQGTPIVRSKLEDMLKQLELRRKASQYSTRSGRQIDILDLEELEGTGEPERQNAPHGTIGTMDEYQIYKQQIPDLTPEELLEAERRFSGQ
jgi:hypothetical protein